MQSKRVFRPISSANVSILMGINFPYHQTMFIQCKTDGKIGKISRGRVFYTFKDMFDRADKINIIWKDVTDLEVAKAKRKNNQFKN